MKRVFGLALILTAVVLVVPMLFAANPVLAQPAPQPQFGPTPSTDLDSYVLFALDELSYKGGNEGTNTRGLVLGGNVGVNRGDSKPGDNTILMSVGANGLFYMSDNTQLVGDSIRLGEEASVYDVYVKVEAGSGWGATNPKIGGPTIRNSKFNPFTLPVLIDPDPAENFNYLIDPADLTTDNLCGTFDPVGTTDITITTDNSGMTLAPGAYRDVQVQNGNTLRLETGTYTVRRFNTGQNVNVYTKPGTIIHVWGDGDPNAREFSIGGNGSYFGSEDPDVESVACICVSDFYTNNTIGFSDFVTFWGVIIAPNSSINLGRACTHYGRFVGQTIGSDFNVNVTWKNCTSAIDVEKLISTDGGTTYVDASTPPGPNVFSDNVSFRFVITNVGSQTLDNVTLTDSVYNGGSTPPFSPSPTSPLAASANYTYDYGPVATVDGQQVNCATATGDYGGTTYTDEDCAYYDGDTSGGDHPDIAVKKYVSVDNQATWEDADSPPGPFVLVGDNVSFKYVVTNVGNVSLDNVTLTDSVYNGGSTPPFSPSPTSPLAASANYTYIYGPIIATCGQHTNVATATGDFSSTTYTDSDPANFLSCRYPTTTVTLLNPPGPILVGQTVQDNVTISTSATGMLPAAGGTWTVEASKDITFTTGVFTVQTDNVSGSLPFSVTTDPWAPPFAGIWYFRATYSGDANYDASGSPPADEQLIVKSGPHVIPSAAVWSMMAVVVVMGATGFLLIRRMKTS